MKKILQLRFLQLGLGGAAIGLMVVGCQSPEPKSERSPDPIVSASPVPSKSPSMQPEPSPSDKPPTPKPSPSSQPLKPTPQVSPSDSIGVSTVPVAVYRMDASCNALVPKTENLPKEKVLDATVGAVIRQSNNADFTVSDYRVTQEGSKVTIVLRLPPSAKRPFSAMSACEQMSLFGALRETLMQRSEWKIRDVQFSDGKEEIMF